jgi:hypothetical protein
MRTLWVKLLVVGLVIALAGTAEAQRPRQPGGRGGPGGRSGGFGRGGFGGFGRGVTLDNPRVREELKVTDEQREEIQKAVAEATKKALTPTQRKRLRQIELQMMGIRAYKEDDVQKALGLKPAQKEKINGMLTEIDKEMAKIRESFRGGGRPGGGRPGAGGRGGFDQIRTMNEKAQEKINELLTSSQKATFKEMLGETFEMGFGGRGGRGGRPGAGGRPGRPGRPGGDRPSRPDF